MRRILLLWRVVKFLCLCIMKIMLYVLVICSVTVHSSLFIAMRRFLIMAFHLG